MNLYELASGDTPPYPYIPPRNLVGYCLYVSIYTFLLQLQQIFCPLFQTKPLWAASVGRVAAAR
jgi:hypothetical protein